MNFRESRRIGAIAIAAVLFAFGVAVFGTAPASAGKPRCTIKGTKGSDKLVGTKGRDVICGFAGNDRIWGRGGNDVIRGGRGDDVIKAGPGNDRLLGEPDDDRLYAGPGNDYLDGGRGRNQLFSGPGNNKCINQETDTRTPGCDDQAPVFAELSVDRNQVDTSTASQSVVVTLRVTDDLAGVRGGPTMNVIHSKSNQQLRIFHFEKVSGDEMDSVWRTTISLPKYAPQGRWSFYPYAEDRQGNYTNIYPGMLDDSGLASGFDQVGPGDDAGPKVAGFSVDRTTIDTSTASQTVNFTVRLTDDISGVGSDQYPQAGRIILDNRAAESYREADLERVSGDEFDGVYRGTVTFPRYTPQGVWKLRIATIDRAGNFGGSDSDGLASRGLASQITQTAPGDSEPPVLKSVTTPDEPISVMDFSEPVVATFRLTDNLSGLKDGFLGLSVQTEDSGYATWIKQIGGTDLDAVYEATVWTGFVPLGTHGIQMGVGDSAGNYVHFDEHEIAALGFASQVSFVE